MSQYYVFLILYYATQYIYTISILTIGLLFDFCWRSLRFALTTQKAVSHGPLPRLLSAVEVTPHGPPTQDRFKKYVVLFLEKV